MEGFKLFVVPLQEVRYGSGKALGDRADLGTAYRMGSGLMEFRDNDALEHTSPTAMQQGVTVTQAGSLLPI